MGFNQPFQAQVSCGGWGLVEAGGEDGECVLLTVRGVQVAYFAGDEM